MFKGINDSKESAHELVKILKGLPIKLNIIPFNEHSDVEFESPDMQTVSDFYDCLASKGIICNVRHSRGSDISAACGQLKSRRKDR